MQRICHIVIIIDSIIFVSVKNIVCSIDWWELVYTMKVYYLSLSISRCEYNKLNWHIKEHINASVSSSCFHSPFHQQLTDIWGICQSQKWGIRRLYHPDSWSLTLPTPGIPSGSLRSLWEKLLLILTKGWVVCVWKGGGGVNTQLVWCISVEHKPEFWLLIHSPL